MYDTDDMNSDWLDNKADLWMEQAEAIAAMLDDEENKDWELFITEPTDEELEEMNANAELLLIDLQE